MSAHFIRLNGRNVSVHWLRRQQGMAQRTAITPTPVVAPKRKP